jgi:release factor glutamine methyltransferase
MKQLKEVLVSSTEVLQGKGIASARRIAEELIAAALQMKRIDLYLQFDRPLQEEELQKIRPLLKRALQGELVDYILGETEFYGVQLRLTPDVLIPRPETELLVDRAVKTLPQGIEVWDLCCGSGAIGIALKKARPDLSVVLSDLSEKACQLAKSNAERNGVEVESLQGDLLDPFQGRKTGALLCNPPYVALSDYRPSAEPELALVGGEDGLLYYRRLKELLPHFLHPGARVLFEIGFDQGERLLTLYDAPIWVKKGVDKDWAGHDRFFFLEFEPIVL